MYKDDNEKQAFKDFLLAQGLSKATSENYSIVLFRKTSTNHKTAKRWFKRFQSFQSVMLENPDLFCIQQQPSIQPEPSIQQQPSIQPEPIDLNTIDIEGIGDNSDNLLSVANKTIKTIQRVLYTDICDEHKIILIKALLTEIYAFLD